MEHLNEQLFEMIRDRFDAVDTKLDTARESFEQHAKTDERYWKVLDEQQAQLSLIKRVFWGLVSLIGTVAAYFGAKH